MASSQFSKVDEYGFVRNADFNYNAYEDFMSAYLKILATRAKKWRDLLTEGKPIVRNNKMKRYVRKGIPSEHRAQIWMAISNIDKMKAEYGKDLYQETLDGPLEQELIDTIMTDLPRTFPDNIYFSNVQLERPTQLYRILLAFAHHNRRIGYCQGLNYIAALLLLVTKNEETVFWLLKVLVERQLPDYYSPTMDGVITDIDALSELVRLRLPDVHRHVTQLGLPWAVIATKWFICLFVDVLPIETVLRVWDCLFYEGSKILFRVGITLISRHRESLLQCEDFGSLVDCFKQITRDSFTLHCHTFMQSIFKTPGTLKRSAIERLRTEVSKERKSKERNTSLRATR